MTCRIVAESAFEEGVGRHVAGRHVAIRNAVGPGPAAQQAEQVAQQDQHLLQSLRTGRCMCAEIECTER